MKATPVIIGVSLLTLLLVNFRLLDRFETTGLDAFNVLRAPSDPGEIVIVGITDEDYRDAALFDETSPLKCEGLKRVLEAIASGNPSVIGVDLDTSSSKTSVCLGDLAVKPPIVWGADATTANRGKSFMEISVLPGLALRDQDSHGIALLPQDADGVIRRYRRTFPTGGKDETPSFSWKVVQVACARGCQNCCDAAMNSSGESLRLNFGGDRFAFPPLSVKDVLDAAAAAAKAGRESVWDTNGLLTGKIVLLGGAYRAARDTHVTPIGELSGLQINAQAIESELRGGGIGSMNEWLAFWLDVTIGYVLVLINHTLRSRLGLALVLSMLCIPVLCLAASYLAFSALALWFNFVPVVVSVLIHEFYHHAREYQQLVRALESPPAATR